MAKNQSIWQKHLQKNRFRQGLEWGVLVGFLLIAVNAFGFANDGLLREIMQVLLAAPIFVFPEVTGIHVYLQVVLFIVYWSIVGGLFAVCLNQGEFARLLVFFTFIVLAGAHLATVEVRGGDLGLIGDLSLTLFVD